MSSTAAVEAEDELIEVGLKVLAAQAMMDAECPDLEVGESAVRPRQGGIDAATSGENRRPDPGQPSRRSPLFL